MYTTAGSTSRECTVQISFQVPLAGNVLCTQHSRFHQQGMCCECFTPGSTSKECTVHTSFQHTSFQVPLVQNIWYRHGRDRVEHLNPGRWKFTLKMQLNAIFIALQEKSESWNLSVARKVLPKHKHQLQLYYSEYITCITQGSNSWATYGIGPDSISNTKTFT